MKKLLSITTSSIFAIGLASSAMAGITAPFGLECGQDSIEVCYDENELFEISLRCEGIGEGILWGEIGEGEFGPGAGALFVAGDDSGPLCGALLLSEADKTEMKCVGEAELFEWEVELEIKQKGECEEEDD